MLCSFVLDVLWWLLGMFPPHPQATCSPSCHNLQEAVQEGSAGPAKELHSVSTKARIGDADGTVQDMGWLRAVHNCIHPVCVEPRWRQMGHPAVIASPLSLSGTAQWAWSMGWPASALFLQQAEQSWSQIAPGTKLHRAWHVLSRCLLPGQAVHVVLMSSQAGWAAGVRCSHLEMAFDFSLLHTNLPEVFPEAFLKNCVRAAG